MNIYLEMTDPRFREFESESIQDLLFDLQRQDRQLVSVNDILSEWMRIKNIPYDQYEELKTDEFKAEISYPSHSLFYHHNILTNDISVCHPSGKVKIFANDVFICYFMQDLTLTEQGFATMPDSMFDGIKAKELELENDEGLLDTKSWEYAWKTLARDNDVLKSYINSRDAEEDIEMHDSFLPIYIARDTDKVVISPFWFDPEAGLLSSGMFPYNYPVAANPEYSMIGIKKSIPKDCLEKILEKVLKEAAKRLR